MRIVAISLLLPALVGTWIGYVTDHSILHLANMGFTGVFFAFTGILIASEVFQEEKVTVDTISGAICVYLLIGMTWAELYSMTEFIEPGSFSIQRYLLQTSGYQPLSKALKPNAKPDCKQHTAVVGRIPSRRVIDTGRSSSYSKLSHCRDC